MSFIPDNQSIEQQSESSILNKKQTIRNDYFIGRPRKNVPYLDLTPIAKQFILYILSYTLNFEIQKSDYYYRMSKLSQDLFRIPGFLLLIPEKEWTKEHLKIQIKEKAIEFRKELTNNDVTISAIQAHVLNKMYRNFLWE